MKTININLGDQKNFFVELNRILGGNLTYKNGESQLSIDDKIGKGYIKGIFLEHNKIFLEFDIVANDDIELKIDNSNRDRVNFIYCSEAALSHKFENEKEFRTIEAFQTTIIANINANKNTIKFIGGERIKTTLISVNTQENLDSVTQKLRETFITEQTDDFFYCGSYNIKILDTLKKIEEIKNKGIVRKLFINGYVNIVLALELAQHKKDVKNAELLQSSLTKSELEIIKEISNFINNYFDNSLPITLLEKKSGLTAVKLQEGFKLMHGQTICEYVKSVRLKKAEEFIVNTDMNISEIVYSLGFSSRSYFSKIFKEKFGISPNIFRKKAKQLVLSA